MASTALSVKSALQARIKQLLPDVEVTWGYPSREPGRKWLMVGRVSWDSSEWATNRSKNEEYSIKVVLSLILPGENGQDVEQALVDLFDEVEDALKSAPVTLGVVGVISTSLEPVSLNAYPMPEGYEGQYEFDYRVTARI